MTTGVQMYLDVDHGHPMLVTSVKTHAVVCESATRATIFGQAKIKGAGSFLYRVSVTDQGLPRAGVDTYSMVLSNGYASGEQILRAGDIRSTP